MPVRGYTSYPFQGFGRGLNLRDKVDSVDPAESIDAMNVLFSDRGAITQRDGYDNLTEVALTNRVASLESYYTSAGVRQLLAGCGTRLEAISTGGKVVASATGLTDAVWDFVRFGKPNAEVAYAGNGTDTLRKWNGTEWTAPTATVNGEAAKAMPKAGSLTVWPAGGNRLVATRFSTATGGPDGAISSPDHVYFSNPGDPEAWTNKEGEENVVQLMPGNGEPITAVIAWREMIFVFKETSFFVFWGVSPDPNDAPQFEFRPIEAGVGAVSPRAVCADENGVYFMSRLGVYRTNGQEPEQVSGSVEPIWTGDISSFYLGGTLAHSSIRNCAMAAYRDLIYLSFPTSEVNDRTLVYDPRADWWSITDLPCAALTSFRVGSKEELCFGYASGSNHIGRHSDSYTNDDGVAIESRWRSGWFDLGSPDVKTIRASKFWGTGKVFCGVGHDFHKGTGALDLLDFTNKTVDEWGSTTWGGGEWAEPRGLGSGHKRRATRGTAFSLYFTNSIKDQTFSLHRTVHHLREIARPSETKS